MKRIVSIIIWVLLTIFQVWFISDMGRDMGSDVTRAIEFHIDSYNDNLATLFSSNPEAQTSINNFTNGALYSMFHDLSKELKSDFSFIVVTSIIYILATVICYDFAIIQPRQQKMIEKISMQKNITSPEQS